MSDGHRDSYSAQGPVDGRMGYFRQIYNLSKDPVTGGYDTTGTIVFGFCIVLSPIGVPLFWIGRVAQKIMETWNDG